MYKIIQNDRVVDVVRVPRFISFLPSGHIAITDKTSAQGIAGSDNKTIYSFKPSSRQDVTTATIKEITLEEFDRLKNLLNSKQEVSADESALAIAKNAVIKRLSKQCKNIITAGFSVKLSDGNTYDFKLTVEDQLNLMSIENQLTAGAETFLYHATGQPCKFFSKEDMTKIISAFKRYTLYHTTYFNVAKQYINSLVDIEKVNRFVYGTDISDTVKDLVIKQILKNGGNLA
jgi:hypothetical protein